MSNNQLATVSQEITVSNEQFELIKNTICKEATGAEMDLFFYDCKRRGVHPLDKLIHFTKRGGKYTPVTSIDFFRMRAHDTDKCAGISDPVFTGSPGQVGFTATVTVKRFVSGQIAEFTATARWEEYKPDQDFMWKKMPHTMLGKCAEALALRKAFPQELQGLYTTDEMAQVDNSRTTGNLPTRPVHASQQVRTSEYSQETGHQEHTHQSDDSGVTEDNYKDVKCHFGKPGALLNKRVGDMKPFHFKWFSEECMPKWEANPDRMTADDLRLMSAIELAIAAQTPGTGKTDKKDKPKAGKNEPELLKKNPLESLDEMLGFGNINPTDFLNECINLGIVKKGTQLPQIGDEIAQTMLDKFDDITNSMQDKMPI